MEVLRPASLADAAALVRERNDALPVAGGTVVAALLNKGRIAPAALVDLGRLEELRGWSDDGRLDSPRRGTDLRRPRQGFPRATLSCTGACRGGSWLAADPQTGARSAAASEQEAATRSQHCSSSEPKWSSLFERRVPLEQVLRESAAGARRRPARATGPARVVRQARPPKRVLSDVAVGGFRRRWSRVRAAATGPGVEATLVSGAAGRGSRRPGGVRVYRLRGACASGADGSRAGVVNVALTRQRRARRGRRCADGEPAHDPAGSPRTYRDEGRLP